MRVSWFARLLTAVAAVIGIAGANAYADIVTQYSFDGDLLDSGPAGVAADDLTPSFVGGSGAETYDLGLVGGAVRVDNNAGSAFRLTAPDSADLRVGANWTLEAYVLPDIDNLGHWDRFWTKWGGTGNNQDWHFTVRYGDDALDLFVKVGAVQTNVLNGVLGRPANTVPVGRWSHIAIVGDSAANQTRAYINGQLVQTGSYLAVPGTIATMDFGNFDAATNDLQWQGLIDEAVIHNTVQDASYLATRAAIVPANPYAHVRTNKEHLAGAHNQFAASTTDLLQTATGFTTGYSPCCDAVNQFGQPDVVLRDGNVGASTSGNIVWPQLVLEAPGVAGGDPNGMFSTTFDLDLAAAPYGYDISQIDTIAGWDAFRSQQRYALWVSKIGTPDFEYVGVFQIEDSAAGASLGTGSSRIQIIGDGGVPVALNVDALRFDFMKTGNSDGGPVYREIDVTGTASAVPEPSTFALAGLGIAAIAVRRLRRRK
jgi:hypothetical protein